jgi:hypothetical protein
MMWKIRSIAAATCTALACTLAHGAPVDVDPKTSFSTDWSDIWWNPSESGWGMQLVQEGSTVFATLFVYGPDNKPTWIIATLTVGNNGVLTGQTFVTTGPFYGAPTFDTNSATIRSVGTMTITFSDVSTGQLTYTVDGVTVNKRIVRQSVGTDNYNGNYLLALNLTQASCTNAANNQSGTGTVAANVAQTGNAMTIIWQFGGNVSCTYTGTYSQQGRLGLFTGPYSCSDTDKGTMTFFELTNRVGMMSGRISGQSTTLGCTYSGRLSGVDPNFP